MLDRAVRQRPAPQIKFDLTCDRSGRSSFEPQAKPSLAARPKATEATEPPAKLECEPLLECEPTVECEPLLARQGPATWRSRGPRLNGDQRADPADLGAAWYGLICAKPIMVWSSPAREGDHGRDRRVCDRRDVALRWLVAHPSKMRFDCGLAMMGSRENVRGGATRCCGRPAQAPV
jgi:hypothetical protein